MIYTSPRDVEDMKVEYNPINLSSLQQKPLQDRQPQPGLIIIIPTHLRLLNHISHWQLNQLSVKIVKSDLNHNLVALVD